MISDKLRNKMLDAAFPNAVWVSLLEKDNEVTCSQCPRQKTDMTQAEEGQTVNALELVFKYVPESTVTHIGVSTTKEGDVDWSVPLVTAKSFQDGDTLTIEPGDLKISLS